MRQILNYALERLILTSGCLAVLALSVAAETGPQAFNWNNADLRTQWGVLKNESAAMADPPARAVSACNSCGLDSGVYSRVLYYRCTNGSQINDLGAKDIAQRAANNSIDVDVFLNAYYRTCNFHSAAEVGEGSRSGSLSAEVYRSVLYYRCTNGSQINDLGALDVAKRAAKGSIKVDVLLNVYYRTCNFHSAVEVACR